jgi:hypothetical protein
VRHGLRRLIWHYPSYETSIPAIPRQDTCSAILRAFLSVAIPRRQQARLVLALHCIGLLVHS